LHLVPAQLSYTQLISFTIDLFIATTGKIDALKAAGFSFFWLKYLCYLTTPFSSTINACPGINSCTSFSPTLKVVLIAALSDAATTTSSFL
jgi:hypothetical protein